jgi:hypothetical protein
MRVTSARKTKVLEEINFSSSSRLCSWKSTHGSEEAIWAKLLIYIKRVVQKTWVSQGTLTSRDRTEQVVCFKKYNSCGRWTDEAEVVCLFDTITTSAFILISTERERLCINISRLTHERVNRVVYGPSSPSLFDLCSPRGFVLISVDSRKCFS